MAAKKHPKKPPLRAVAGDSYVVMVDGEVYRPHEGETAWFSRKGLTYAQMRTALKVNRLEQLDSGDMSAEEMESLQNGLDFLMGNLADGLVKWDFTDDDGNPYPEHPTLEELQELDYSLVSWLMNAMRQGVGAATRGNVSTPSTDS